MPWLLRDGQVLASAEVAGSVRARMRGLLGRDSLEGVLILRPARSVHTVRMRFPVDVAYCDRDLTVVRMHTMPRNRVGLPVWRARCVIEAEAGSFERWGLTVGDRLEIEGTPPP
jgi:uncharacterized membrane protein (UPF0127 family)